MSELTVNEATALMAAGMYASPPTEAQMKDGIERAESWLAAHDRQVKAEVREALAADLDLVSAQSHHTAEYSTGLRHAADLVRPAYRIKSQETP